MGKDNSASTDSLLRVIQDKAKEIKNAPENATNPESSPRPAGDIPGDVEPHNETPSSDLLKRKKGNQNLEHREKLINRLHRLFVIQMCCMNIIVAFVIFASYVKLPWLRDMSDTKLSTLTTFMTFYITAVLAELLAAIVYIVHKVFSE